MERLERVVEAKGRLLKADRIGGPGPRLASGILLTFDVGRLLVEVDAAADKVRTVAIAGVEEIPPQAEDASEAEPWWRVIGSPLARVWAGEVGAQGLRLQFRADQENPKFISLRPSGAEVEVTLEPQPGS